MYFHRTESPTPRTKVYVADVPEGASLAELLDLAYASGMPRGSHRRGCFEIQTDDGIWMHPGEKNMRCGGGVFKTWDQFELED